MTFWGDQLAFDRSGIIRDINGRIIGERGLEMDPPSPIDLAGPGGLKALLAGGLLIAGLKTVSRPAVKLLQKDLEHIVLRHWATSGAKNAGKFSSGTTIKGLRDMINQTIANGTVRPNTNGRPGLIYEYTFGHQIGINSSGGAAFNLRVVVRPGDTVVTAFPY